MKTSNKLLVGMFAVIFLSLTTFICIGRHYYYTYGTSVKQSGEIKEETRIQADFTSVKIEGGIKVIFIEGANPSVVLKGDKNYLGKVETVVKDGELGLRIPFNVKEGQQIEAIISTGKFETITCSKGVEFESAKTLTSTKITLRFDTGVSGKLSINAQETILDCSTGADITLTGNSNSMDVNAFTGVVLNAFDFTVHKATIHASTGSVLNINTNNEISGNLSTGSILTNHGSASTTNLRTDTGATVANK